MSFRKFGSDIKTETVNGQVVKYNRTWNREARTIQTSTRERVVMRAQGGGDRYKYLYGRHEFATFAAALAFVVSEEPTEKQL